MMKYSSKIIAEIQIDKNSQFIAHKSSNNLWRFLLCLKWELWIHTPGLVLQLAAEMFTSTSFILDSDITTVCGLGGLLAQSYK